MAVKIEDLEAKKIAVHEDTKRIMATAEAEGDRELTAEEQATIEKNQAAFDSFERDIQNRLKLAAQEERINAPVARLVKPDGSSAEGPNASVTRPPAKGSGIEDSSPKGMWGWRTFGQFATAVRAAVRGNVDPRLMNAPTSYGSETVSPDGGYAVPPDFRQAIMVKVNGEDSLLAKTDQQTTSTNQITVPTDETTPWASSGGIQLAWEAEAAQRSQSKPALQQTTVRTWKLDALVPITSELLEDAPALSNYLSRKVPEKFVYKLNDAIVNGTGVGMPLGLMKSAAKVAVAKESTQSAASVVPQNLAKMYARMPASWLSDAIWLVNPDVLPQLILMVLGGTTAANPVYLPPGGFASAPYGTILGRPVFPSDTCATMGTEGDVIFTNLKQYLSVVQAGGLRQDISVHLWFDYDVTAFKFTMRVGGQPWWSTYIAPANGSNNRSAIVTTAVRP